MNFRDIQAGFLTETWESYFEKTAIHVHQAATQIELYVMQAVTPGILPPSLLSWIECTDTTTTGTNLQVHSTTTGTNLQVHTTTSTCATSSTIGPANGGEHSGIIVGSNRDKLLDAHYDCTASTSNGMSHTHIGMEMDTGHTGLCTSRTPNVTQDGKTSLKKESVSDNQAVSMRNTCLGEELV
jgi:hypothetical protein